MSQPKEPIAVVGDIVDPGQVKTYSYRIPESAVITGLRVRCYSGQAHALKYSIRIIKGGEERSVNLIRDLSGDNSVSGNDETFQFNVRQYLDQDDIVEITVVNVCSTYEYTTSLKADIDYNRTVFEKIDDRLNNLI